MRFFRFQALLFYPRYYVAINRRVIEQSADEIKRLNCIKFLSDHGANHFVPESALTYLMHTKPERCFHSDLTGGFFEGYTVTFAALQRAFFMGFSSVVIVGMDHRYDFQGSPNEARVMHGKDPNHFVSSYFSGNTWDNPDLKNSERFYSMAREAFEKSGRNIVDCTVDGACTIFERGRLEDVLR